MGSHDAERSNVRRTEVSKMMDGAWVHGGERWRKEGISGGEQQNHKSFEARRVTAWLLAPFPCVKVNSRVLLEEAPAGRAAFASASLLTHILGAVQVLEA